MHTSMYYIHSFLSHYSKKIAKVPITCQEEFNALRGLLSKNIKIGLLAGWAVTLVVAFANIFSVIDLDSADTGIMGLNIPFVYDQYILGPVVFAIISYLIVHNYEKHK